MHVASKSLNIRSKPLVSPATLIASLPFGHKVKVLGAAEREGWVNAETTYQGKDISGVLSSANLRVPESDAKEALLAVAAVEWDRFDRGAGKEHVAPYWQYVGEMWDAIGETLTGKNRDVPWSAACISFIVRRAGYKGFKFAAAHAKYIHEAVVARLNNDESKDFWAYRTSEQKPAIGDLVCRKRSTAKITYDTAKTRDDFLSHTDFVVAIGDGYVDAVGGNVSHSVSITRYALDGAGFLDGQGGRVFAVMKNRR
jgi:hypothetical protein